MIEILKIVAFVGGLLLIITTVLSAIKTFVVPRNVRPLLPRYVFQVIFYFMRLWIKKTGANYNQSDRILAYFAPISLLTLLVTWLGLLLLGYMALYWAVGVTGFREIMTLSGSCLFTLGFSAVSEYPSVLPTLVAFTESINGLILVALLISYLPTIYSAFQHREQAVALLDTRAGAPPSPIELILRYNFLQRPDLLIDLWVQWELWFIDTEESHTSLSALSFFRSPQPNRSWVNASATILDGAALYMSVVADETPRFRAGLCLRTGYMALRRIADAYRLAYNPEPKRDDPISLTRADFDEGCAMLQKYGVALVADLDKAWRDFAGWRVNYDEVVAKLHHLTYSPALQWLPGEHWYKLMEERAMNEIAQASADTLK